MVHKMDVAHSVPLELSREMRAKLKSVLDSNRGRGFWADEVASPIAAPLSALNFCRSALTEQLRAGTAPAFDAERTQLLAE